MSNTLAVTAVAVVVGSTEAKLLVTGKPLAVEPVIAGFVLGLFLFALEAAAPKVTGYFCVLVIITALLVNGVSVFNAGTTLFQPRPTKTK